MADDPPRKSKHHGDKKKKKSSKDKDKAAAATSTSDSTTATKDKRRSRKDHAAAAAPAATVSHVVDDDPLALHKAAYKNDIDKVRALLDAENPHNHRAHIDELDGRGNAPLHIAAHFAFNDLVDLFLANNANPEVLSKAGWRPLEESIATGARQVAETLMKAGHTKYRQDMETNAAKWHRQLAELPDFYMELHWEFSVLGGWVPLVSSFIPNDVYRIWKRGSAVRMDYSLTGFKSFRITRGHVSFVFTGQDQQVPGHLYVLDHDRKTRQDFCELPGGKYDKQIDDALNYVFSHDICSHLPLSADDASHTVEFVARTGWFSSSPVTEDVHGVKAAVFNTHGCQFRSLIRSDPHAKQTRIPRSLQDPELFGEQRQLFDQYFDLSQSDPFSVTEKYDGFTWPTENVSRKIKKFEGSLWMAPDFPLTVAQFLSLIEVYSPTNQAIKQLSEFLGQNIPEGFPVKIQIPVYYLLSATVQFRNFEHTVPEPELFEIPDDYETIAEAYIGNEAREMFKSVRDSKSKGGASPDADAEDEE